MTAYLEFTGPDSLRRVVHEAAGKVSLNTTDHVVVLGVRAFSEVTNQ